MATTATEVEHRPAESGYARWVLRIGARFADWKLAAILGTQSVVAVGLAVVMAGVALGRARRPLICR